MQQKRILWIVIISSVTALIAFGSYRIIGLTREVAQLKMSPADQAKKDTETLVSQVRALIAVPEDEVPTVATVSDPEKLKSNAFFASAITGDKVLIYTEAKKAILFRPGENKIIEVAPLSIGSSSATAQVASIRFVLYNGTTTTGPTKKYETELKDKIPSAVVVDRDNAKKNDYGKSILVNLSGSTSSPAGALGIAAGELPEGEVKPTGADFLIILGADKK